MSPAWSLVEVAARPLNREERDAILGDSLEAGENTWQALCGVLGLIARRQLLLWKSWRPWLSVFGFGIPCTILLMAVSMSVTCTFDRLMGFKVSHWAPTGHEGFTLLLCHIFLLIAWSWTTGFTLGSLSPRTLWVNASLGGFLAFFFARHLLDMLGVSRFAPFLFLLPAIWGIRQSLRGIRLSFRPAVLLATTMAVLMTAAWTNEALWLPNWLLIIPALFLVATRSGMPGTGEASARVSQAR